MTDSPKPSLFRPVVGQRGITQLHWAAYCGDIEEAHAALSLGCDVNAVDLYRGYTPLHWLADMAATGGDRMEVLELLVRHGAAINVRSSTDMTALGLARESGSELGDRLADTLVRLGAVD